MEPEEIFDGKHLEMANAILNDDLNSINKIVEEGLDLDKIFQENVTLLLWAMTNDNELSVRELLKLGANPNLKDNENIQPIYYATIADEDSKYLKILLENKADPNGGGDGQTPVIHDALINEFWGNLDLLLQYGADINKTDKDGDTIAMKCAYLNWFKELNMLIGKGARIDVETERGEGGIPLQVQENEAELEEFIEAQAATKQILLQKGIEFPVIRPYELPYSDLRNQWYQTPIGREWKNRLTNISSNPRGFGKAWTDAKTAENASLRMWMQENNIREPQISF
jgi:uncharacterized protein